MKQKISFSNRGHVFAATGAAVGIANLVLFPARVYNYGGLAFILVFVLCTFLLGIPLMIGETALGKHGQSDAVDAYQGIGKGKWGYAGVLGLITCCFVLSFYIVVAGWALYYLYLYVFDIQSITTMNTGQLFGEFVTNETQVFLFSGLFMIATIVVVAGGVRKGIEAVSKRFVPLLVVLVLILILLVPVVKGEALNYGNFTFDFGALFKVDASGRMGIIEAVGQAFFSLSLGSCGMVTFGAHTHKETNVVENANFIVHTDTIVAILGGLLIIPLFAANEQVMAAPPLVFINLVETFNGFGDLWGRIIGVLFFALFNIAIITSAISLLEPTVNYLARRKKQGRKFYAIAVGTFIFVMSIPVILSVDATNPAIFTNFLGYGDNHNGEISMGYFNFVLDFFGTFCLIAGSFILATFISRKWTMEGIFKEITVAGYSPSDRMKQFLTFTLKWFIPAVMLLMFVAEFYKVMVKLGVV
ncbi:MAG: sodium-dependent transporter [Flammeovirgaceae bacterium]